MGWYVLRDEVIQEVGDWKGKEELVLLSGAVGISCQSA